MNRLQTLGYEAAKSGAGADSCPYKPIVGERHQRAEWLLGFDKAASEQPKQAPALVKVHPFDVEIPVKDGDYISTELFERMERSRDARLPYVDTEL